jgi:hypothetical protein
MKKSKPALPEPQPGTVVCIPLPDGRYAYAKVFRGNDFGVYDLVSRPPASLAEVSTHPFLYHQLGTDEAVRSGAWPTLGIEPFADEESAWGPPQAGGIYPDMEIDPIMLQIQHKGRLRRASLEEVQGLDIAWICQTPEQFVETLEQRLLRRDHSGRRVGA